MNNKKIKDVVADFLWHCRYEKALDKKTIKAYGVDLNQFINCISDCVYINLLTKVHLKYYLRTIQYLQPKTINRKIASLRAMLNYYECEDESFINPMRRMQIKLKVPIKLPVVMTLDEMRAILMILYDMKSAGGVGNSMLLRNIAIIELLFASGMRVSELCGLSNRDVDIIHGTVKIVGKGNKERIIQICHAETLRALREWNETKGKVSPNFPFFTNRLGHGLSTQSVRSLIHQVVKNCGLDKHITPHTFRHTFATLLLEEDVDIKYIQHLLGHSSIVTTQIYTHVNMHKQRQILSDKHPRRLI